MNFQSSRLLTRSKLFVFMWCALSSQRIKAADEDSKIVGGFALALKNAPFIVSLQYRGSHFCGGSLVTLSHVLSGCHCLTTVEKGMKHEDLRIRNPNDLAAVVGTENIKNPTSEFFQERPISEIQVHPNCSFVHIMIYDFAVAYLQSAMMPSPEVKPFKMYATTRHEYDMKTKALVNSKQSYCYVAGWGSADPKGHTANPFLKAARMTVITDTSCRKLLGQQNEKFINYDFSGNAMLCTLSTGYQRNESDCIGDSGGPFFCGPSVFGIVSFGFECGMWDVPNVYAKISYAVDWLQSLRLSHKEPETKPRSQANSDGENKNCRLKPALLVVKISAAIVCLSQ